MCTVIFEQCACHVEGDVRLRCLLIINGIKLKYLKAREPSLACLYTVMYIKIKVTILLWFSRNDLEVHLWLSSRNSSIVLKGPLSYKYILTSVDVYESIHHKIITC